MKEVTIWTDGACSGNPGPGGWGAILEYKDTRLEMSGGEYMTTNNRMELTAAIEALESLKEPCAVTLYSDSEYMVNAMTKGWAAGWKKRRWMKADKTPAKNPDLFEKLLDLCAIHQVKFIWVRGHAADENNNRCDELAVAQRDAHTR
ncbi:MAG: ribonuclease HI [Clostridiales bacterium]|nr:ribonuclease HI [Clostridiales bacterium]